MPLSKKLERQIKKVFEGSHLSLDAETVKKNEDFFQLVDSAYSQFEDRLQTVNRNLEISSQELNSLNRTIHGMLDSLGQGFITFDKNGICSPTYSKASEDLLEIIPSGKSIIEVLRIPPSEQEEIQLWIQALFEEKISFNDIASLGPPKFNHSKKWSIHLEFKASRNFNGQIENVIMICTDRTNEEKIKAQMKEKEEYVNCIVKLIKEKNNVMSFLKFCSETLLQIAAEDLTLIEFKRKVHTLKGGAASFLMNSFKLFLEEFETSLKDESLPYKDKVIPFASESQRQIDRFVSEFSFIFGERAETVQLSKTQVFDFLENLKSHPEIKKQFTENFLKIQAADLVKTYESRVQSVARDLSKKLNPIEVSSDDIRIYSKPYSHFFASLIHVFRNSIDHGIESPAERLDSGKSESGSIRIHLRNMERNGKKGFEIDIEDDGRGIDFDKIRQKLKGENTKPQDFPEDELLKLLMKGNLSSRDQVGEYSGRGVGISAVYEEITKCGGDLEIKSLVNKGMRLRFFLPFIDEKF